MVFSVAAMAVAWTGAYVDTFALPMDETSAHALGSPEYAYGVVVGSRFIVMGIASIIFTLTLFVTRPQNPDAGSGALRAVTYGSALSAIVFVLGELGRLAPGIAFVLIWVAVVAGAVVLGRRFAER
jgi:hypothetical protein